METLEAKLALKEISRLEKQGYGYHAQVTAAMRLLVGQGFSEKYSQEVAEACWDELFD
jgi:hypothetical protein